MIDQFSAIVGNGSGGWVWGYEPWLPFYDFFPLLILASVGLTCGLYLFAFTRARATRAILWGSVFFTSGLFAVASVFVLWVKLDLNPVEVFYWWSLNWILIMLGQGYYILTNERVKEQIREMEDREI